MRCDSCGGFMTSVGMKYRSFYDQEEDAWYQKSVSIYTCGKCKTFQEQDFGKSKWHIYSPITGEQLKNFDHQRLMNARQQFGAVKECEHEALMLRMKYSCPPYTGDSTPTPTFDKDLRVEQGYNQAMDEVLDILKKSAKKYYDRIRRLEVKE